MTIFESSSLCHQPDFQKSTHQSNEHPMLSISIPLQRIILSFILVEMYVYFFYVFISAGIISLMMYLIQYFRMFLPFIFVVFGLAERLCFTNM